MLEHGIAHIITPIDRLHDYLCRRNAALGPGGRFGQQAYNESQNDVVNGENDSQEITKDGEKMKDNCADCAEEIKVMKQERKEMK